MCGKRPFESRVTHESELGSYYLLIISISIHFHRLRPSLPVEKSNRDANLPAKMIPSQTPQRCMLPRSETSLSPPPLKRKRTQEGVDLLETTCTLMLPASLFLPDDLVANVSHQGNLPRLCLKPRTCSPLPFTSERTTTSLLHSLAAEMPKLVVPPQPRRMKRRRSSISSCGLDKLGRLEIAHIMPMV